MHDAIKELHRSQFWAATVDHLRAIRAGALMAQPELWAARAAPKTAGDITVVPIMGTLTQRGGFFGVSTERVQQSFQQAMADGSRAVVLEIDSPGGEVMGIEELASVIRAARGAKPIVAVANSFAASAAYYLAAQADEIFVTPSGMVGSVGVYCAHADWSRFLDQAGITITIISAGEGKADGNEFEPLGDAAKADIQADIDRYYGMFASAVAKGRGVGVDVVRSQWKAKVYGAKEAVAIGMADQVGTIDDAMRRAGAIAQDRRAVGASVDVEIEARRRIRSRAGSGTPLD